MDGIGRKSPPGKDGYRNKYLKTLRNTPRATVIDAVPPIRPALNQLNNPKPGFLFNIEILYQRAEDMMGAYKNLNDQEEKFGDLMKAFREDPEGFLSQIMELVKQFNQTTAVVLTFDRVFKTAHTDRIADMLARQQFALEQIGIRIVGINQLQFDGAYFRRAVRTQTDFFSAVFVPALSLFDQIFTIISAIRIPTEASAPLKTAKRPQDDPATRINRKV